MACANCGQDDGHHDSLHCPYTAIKLFGVRITNAPNIPKSASTGNLPHLGRSDVSAGVSEDSLVRKSASAGNLLHVAGGGGNQGKDQLDGYASDGLLQTRRFVCSSTSHAHDLKNKGIPWSEEEHKLFLLGLQELGKGKWRGIARTYVRTRTPVQVASHAQKFFLRHSKSNMKKKRSSLFDMPLNKTVISHPGQPNEDQSRRPTIFQSLNSRHETMYLTNEAKSENLLHTYHPLVQLDQSIGTTSSSPPTMKALEMEAHDGNVQSSTTPHPKSLVNVDELLAMSKLRLKGPANNVELGSSISLSLSLNMSNQHFATGKGNSKI